MADWDTTDDDGLVEHSIDDEKDEHPADPDPVEPAPVDDPPADVPADDKPVDDTPDTPDDTPEQQPTPPQDTLSEAHLGLSEGLVFAVKLSGNVAQHLANYNSPMQATAKALADFLQGYLPRLQVAHDAQATPGHPGSAGADSPGMAQ